MKSESRISVIVKLVVHFRSRPPPLCGAIPASLSTVVQPGDHVAALVPEPDVAATAACNLSEGCILAEVVLYDADKRTYQVEDVDAEEGKV